MCRAVSREIAHDLKERFVRGEERIALDKRPFLSAPGWQ
jgi:hypothetical protein